MQNDRSLVTFTAAPGAAMQVPVDVAVQDALQLLLDLAQPSVADALALARVIGGTGMRPGLGATQQLWELLATVAAHDLGSARAVEPHLDALAILGEAEGAAVVTTEGARAGAGVDTAAAGGDAEAAAGSTWGVFASEGGGAAPLAATATADGGFTLTGLKPWCSLADRLDRALITATIDAESRRQLFAVDLHHPGVTVLPGEWHALGLREIPSGPVRFESVPATEVGAPGWYLTRPGFWWGAIGVAACWYGGAVGVARTLFDAAAARTTPDPFLLLHLGAVDAQLNDCRRALAEAATLVDAGAASGPQGALLAYRVRATVARASESVLKHVAHALGPAPLAQNAAHAKRVADLELYLRQHHAEKDDAALGSHLLAGVERGDRPW